MFRAPAVLTLAASEYATFSVVQPVIGLTVEDKQHASIDSTTAGQPYGTEGFIYPLFFETQSRCVSQAGVQGCHLGSLQPPPPGSSDSPASASRVHHHARLIFVLSVELGFHHAGQAGLELLTSGDPPTSASQSAGITVCFGEIYNSSLLHPDHDTGRHRLETQWSSMRQPRGKKSPKGPTFEDGAIAVRFRPGLHECPVTDEGSKFSLKLACIEEGARTSDPVMAVIATHFQASPEICWSESAFSQDVRNAASRQRNMIPAHIDVISTD
ncbi:hypothetical protein AAY473_037782 [Plecturocebus cupreus]